MTDSDDILATGTAMQTFYARTDGIPAMVPSSVVAQRSALVLFPRWSPQWSRIGYDATPQYAGAMPIVTGWDDPVV